MLRILVVEDSDTDAAMVQFALRTHGHEVFVAETGEAALDELRRENFQVLITDWEFPGMSGLELCRTVRERPSNHYMYIVMLTSRDEKSYVIDGLAAGADDRRASAAIPGRCDGRRP